MSCELPLISTFIKEREVKNFENDFLTYAKKQTWSKGNAACFGFNYTINKNTFGIGVTIFKISANTYRFHLSHGINFSDKNYRRFDKPVSYSIILEQEALKLLDLFKALVKEKLETNTKTRLLVATGAFSFIETPATEVMRNKKV